MAQQSKAESFSAYLEAWERSKPNPPASSGTALAVLHALAGSDQMRMPVKDLMTVSSMTFTDFADCLKNLQQSGYLTLSGPPGAEVARLTPLGEDVSRLARSQS